MNWRDSTRRAEPRVRRRQRNQHGIVGAEVMPFVVLVFVGGTLLFVQAWAVVDAKIAATAGAREATRTFVEHRVSGSPDPARPAIDAGERAMSGHGLGGVSTVAPYGTTRLSRCARATFEATQEVPEVAQLFRGWSPMSVRARSSEIVDPFRHGLSGQAPCGT